MKKSINMPIAYNSVALTLLLVGEICFFKSETIYVYWILTGGGIIISLLSNLSRFSLKIRKDNFILWLTMMYGIYFFYGIFFTQKGEFPWDTMLYRYVECIALYLSISLLLVKDINALVKSFSISGIISIIYLISIEGANIIHGSIRIGDSLSGNVNTVGFNLGIISTVIMWSYCKEKKVYKLLLFMVFAIFMLITGSKKTLIILIIDTIILFIYERRRLSGWIKILMLSIIGVYIIFNVPYFYNIIGFRIESMIDTLLYGKTVINYSYSTEVRDEMVSEGLRLFLNKPVFGGGWNYYYSKTIYGYEYSHCNYVEMLCTFGIIGTFLFYNKHFSNIRTLLRYRKFKNPKNIDLIIIAFLFIIEALILDWSAVTFSAQSVWYIPIIFSSAAIYAIRNNETSDSNEV